MDRYYWGVDLGGTKIECAVIERNSDICVVRERIATESDQGYSHILNQIKLLIDRCVEQLGQRPQAIGFGTPGTLDPHYGVMKNCNSTALNGKPLDKDLMSLLGVKVVLANDANCFALAEAHFGAAKRVKPDAEVVFGIIMGTGVGSGVVVNGKGLYGRHGIAGEWGHNVIEPNGAACYCGQSGCLETVISGKGLERFYTEQSGRVLPLPEIVALAANNDLHAQATMARMSNYFGIAVAQIINVLDPDVIVIGGGVGNIDALYQQAEQAILPHLFNGELNTLIVKPDLGDSAGVFGAAALVK
ncbi:sugar kinase [Photobacterium kishitanii]|uniref:ROK family protein n=1 Tax=Photobacterium kishitanii TaxID=318456 RepID=UPI0007EF401A|nr:ROK family protein [Photobacterium kishitanii]OBU28014.1 sugar kinase [Photobacterium kishitanii]PSU89800.1 sugar kinase [Photobacterium kishitanii]PSW68831.1 sugar kinase [Photobacterium kishitanii]